MWGLAARSTYSLRLLRKTDLQLIYAASLLMMMGSSLIYPILPVIHESLRIPKEQIGLVLSAFALPAVFMAPLAGFIADLRGRKWVMVGGLFLYGLAGFGITVTNDFTWLLVLRTVQGVGYSGVMPLVVVLIGDTYTREQETTAQGMKVFIDLPAVWAGCPRGIMCASMAPRARHHQAYPPYALFQGCYRCGAPASLPCYLFYKFVTVFSGVRLFHVFAHFCPLRFGSNSRQGWLLIYHLCCGGYGDCEPGGYLGPALGKSKPCNSGVLRAGSVSPCNAARSRVLVAWRCHARFWAGQWRHLANT